MCSKLQPCFLTSICNFWYDTFKNHFFRISHFTAIVFLVFKTIKWKHSRMYLYFSYGLVNNDAATLVLLIWTTRFFHCSLEIFRKLFFFSYGRNSHSYINIPVQCVASVFKYFRITDLVRFLIPKPWTKTTWRENRLFILCFWVTGS